jgi:beta-lactamase class D
MKSVATPILILAFILGSVHAPAQKPGDSLIRQLNLFLDQWHRDASDANLEAYIGAMSADGVFIGTDPTEYWTTSEFRAFCKPYFEKKRTWTFRAFQRNIYTGPNGNYAWFDELLSTQMGICRGSGILQKNNGEWKISQYVLSPTVPNDQMKAVTRNKGKADTLLIMKTIFDKYNMDGTILIFDLQKGEYSGYNPSKWDSGYLPASTFKIPNTLIGLETGVIDTGYIFRWKGEKRRLPQWERDLKLKEAFQVSCVPCYQEVARKIGEKRMNEFLAKMNYGKMDVRKENIDLFWLEGNSRITPRQQVDFLRRLYLEQLPLSKATMNTMKEIMVNEVTPDYNLRGKTGWAIRNGNNYGWFVGWIETKGKVYFVATLIEPKDNEQIDDFAIARKTITMEFLRWMGIVSQ